MPGNGLLHSHSLPFSFPSLNLISIPTGLPCWLDGRKDIRPGKKTEWLGAGMVVCLERAADLHIAQLMPLPLTISYFNKIQIGFIFLVPAYPRKKVAHTHYRA